MDVVATWTGRQARALRTAWRLTIEGFAEKLGVATRTVAKWEGDLSFVPALAMQQVLDTALEQAPAPVRSRLSLLLTCPGTDEAGLGNGDAGDVSWAIGAMQAFRMADLRVGGAHLYPAVAGYLQDEVAPRLVSLDASPDCHGIFTAAAAITEMAGWMAHDAGSDAVARRHFSRCLQLVRAGGDRRVKAHVLASMSHLEEHLHQPGDAVRLAHAGRETLAGGPRNPDLEARLYAMEARARAALRDGPECVRLLTCAEKALGAPQDEEPCRWVGSFDEGSLASEAVRCMRHLGDLAEAQRQAARIIALRPVSRPRSRAFGQLMLAGTLAEQGRHEEACSAATVVLNATPALGSHIVVQQLRDLTRLLEPHHSARTVSDFLTRLDSAIRQRQWLFRELGNEGPVTATSGVPA